MENSTLWPSVYCEIQAGMPTYGDLMCAVDGFEHLNYEVKTFELLSTKVFEPDFLANSQAGDVVIGGVIAMRKHFQALRCLPPTIDYPEIVPSLVSGRTSWLRSLRAVAHGFNADVQEVFVKPCFTKLRGFDAGVYNWTQVRELMTLHDPETPVYVSPKDTYLSEYRVFVHKGQIMDIRRYRGDYKSRGPSLERVEDMVASYKDAPVSYALDVAVNARRWTVLVEINDFWAIAAYGLDSTLYSTMLRDRYKEIIESGYNPW